jgi:hypothetical protein
LGIYIDESEWNGIMEGESREIGLVIFVRKSGGDRIVGKEFGQSELDNSINESECKTDIGEESREGGLVSYVDESMYFYV